MRESSRWFSDAVRQALAQPGMTTRALGSALGVSHTTIAEYADESADELPDPRFGMVLKMLEYMGGDFRRALPAVEPTPELFEPHPMVVSEAGAITRDEGATPGIASALVRPRGTDEQVRPLAIDGRRYLVRPVLAGAAQLLPPGTRVVYDRRQGPKSVRVGRLHPLWDEDRLAGYALAVADGTIIYLRQLGDSIPYVVVAELEG